MMVQDYKKSKQPEPFLNFSTSFIITCGTYEKVIELNSKKIFKRKYAAVGPRIVLDSDDSDRPFLLRLEKG